MTLLGTRAVMIGAGAVLVLETGSTAAYAALAGGPVDGSGVIHGCWTNTAINGTHVFVLQDAGTTCPKGTTAISWNQQGPTGAAGPAGPAGATGRQGQRELPARRGRRATPAPRGRREIPARQELRDRQTRPARMAVRCSTAPGHPPTRSATTVTSTSTPPPTCCTGLRPVVRGRPWAPASSVLRVRQVRQDRKDHRGRQGRRVAA
jgi:hypothetical protein